MVETGDANGDGGVGYGDYNVSDLDEVAIQSQPHYPSNSQLHDIESTENSYLGSFSILHKQNSLFLSIFMVVAIFHDTKAFYHEIFFHSCVIAVSFLRPTQNLSHKDFHFR